MPWLLPAHKLNWLQKFWGLFFFTFLPGASLNPSKSLPCTSLDRFFPLSLFQTPLPPLQLLLFPPLPQWSCLSFEKTLVFGITGFFSSSPSIAAGFANPPSFQTGGLPTWWPSFFSFFLDFGPTSFLSLFSPFFEHRGQHSNFLLPASLAPTPPAFGGEVFDNAYSGQECPISWSVLLRSIFKYQGLIPPPLFLFWGI